MGPGAADTGGGEREESVCGGTRFAGGGTQYACGVSDVEAWGGGGRGEEVDCAGGGEFAAGVGGISFQFLAFSFWLLVFGQRQKRLFCALRREVGEFPCAAGNEEKELTQSSQRRRGCRE